ncbi:MAG TPA: DUF6084 family protein [Candidatus Udaeobacter sp.]|nr:DUF6084 family protein [Candidatus Udaeobacter sp.]
MPDLDFKITGIEPARRGLAPLLHFILEVTNSPETETIQTVMLQAQIQIQAPGRVYNADEKKKLKELFGAPEDWGQTLRTRLWTHANTIIPQFHGHTTTILAVPCTFDFNVAATKYFYALEEGDVPLLFLFSGTTFYTAPDGRLQIQKISWEKECSWRMPIARWQELMEHHYPDSAWIAMRRDVFDQLCEFKRREGLSSWDEVLERLLALNGSVAP